MRMADALAAAPVWSFGAFRLDTQQQALFEGERRVRLGGRAFDILRALVEQAGELVPREVLVGRVWPGIFVDDSTLRVHVAALRRVLGADEGERRYIVNVPGRGYVFAAPVQRLDRPGLRPVPPRTPTSHLPPSLVRMVGRDEALRDLAAQMSGRRLMTIVGPGGMGKTTLALEVAEALTERHAEGARFLDLAVLSDPALLPAAVASTLEVPWLTGEMRDLVAALRGRSLLLVMDNCEHLVDAAATLAETLLAGVPGLKVLATSREPLRAAGEWVHRLAPLDLPPEGTLTAAQALGHAAVQLFHERACANMDGFALDDAAAPLAASICRRLEGIPLAIELAAARVEFLGLAGLAEGLDDSLSALARGRRTARPRHRTLRGTLDWSHDLLDPTEQALLRRLAVFRGGFTQAAAQAVAGDPVTSRATVMEGLASLAAKSLLAVDISGEAPRYRLLAMTRAYAAEKLAASAEEQAVAARHARLCLDVLAGAERDWEALERAPWLDLYAGWIDDLRAALDRCFAPDGDLETGAALTAASTPLWFALSLVQEFRARAEQALAALPATALRGTGVELTLCLSAGAAIFNTRGPAPEMAALSSRALALAEQQGSTSHRLRALWAMARERYVQGEYPAALTFCERFSEVAEAGGDASAALVRDRMMGLGLHLVGRQAEARRHAARALDHPAEALRTAHKSFHEYDNRVAARSHLARILWMQGEPDAAAAVAEEGLVHALSPGYPPPLCYLLSFAACPVAFWNGDLPAAERHVALLLERSANLSFGYWESWRRLHGEVLAFARAEAAARPQLAARIRAMSMGAIQADLLGSFHPLLASPLARRRAAENAASWCAPEILRGEALALLQDGAPAEAEAVLHQALGLARLQGARGWELRIATNLAELDLPGQPRAAALDRLADLRARFAAGSGTADLRRADALLAAG
jgi:predicted ATPase